MLEKGVDIKEAKCGRFLQTTIYFCALRMILIVNVPQMFIWWLANDKVINFDWKNISPLQIKKVPLAFCLFLRPFFFFFSLKT